ncbi:hypothetical protein E5Z49_00895 [Listeria monocytogenes]|uniref:Uncharacterized protein n=1 Tax=Listeria monocytogenes TaxID=1639 RepID=A0AAN2XA57_LISMN|nr:hypothetical protein [Listeria monocytogenes]EAC6871561.1 hypothetical protein [Listeria monocytogenes]EAD1931675.1 hypothetical protein [Listeria monocytogenes]EAE6296617.1 hypothetical protein [Listeria monocytogenes]EAF5832063.1 hypothetical protein [Listeria monocytogenes]EAF8225867.1 hypothetical protein [Listeria monocytogenes]
MSTNFSVQQILSNYNRQQVSKIQDFLISEIDKDNLEETIDFLTSSDIVKQAKYKDILYTGEAYEGLYIEGNQYLISSIQDEVLILDAVSEENGISEEQTRVKISLQEFIYLVNNKKDTLDWIKLN